MSEREGRIPPVGYSQSDEEARILEFFGDRTGRFLDVGAFDGKTFSNTYRLAEKGWSGVLVEPNPTSFVEMLKNYHDNPKVKSENMMFVNAAVAPARGFAEFYMTDDAISTLDAKHRDMWHNRHDVPYRTGHVYVVTMSDLLSTFSGFYDFINIDVEGGNWELAKTIDFGATGASLLCIEHESKIEQIENYCSQWGFERVHVTDENIILGRPDPPTDEDGMVKGFLDLHDVHKNWIETQVFKGGLTALPTLFATAAITSKILGQDIEGCLVECGVFKGSHPAVMQYSCRFMGKHRLVYLFDSFEGIPKAGPEDREGIAQLVGRVDGAQIEPSGVSVCSLNKTSEYMREWGADPTALRFVKGWFHQTLPTTDVGPIALLRIDADLYESTKVCMKYLYPRVVNGGYVIVDDWRLRGVKKAVCDALGGMPQDCHEIPDGVVDQGQRPIFWRVHR